MAGVNVMLSLRLAVMFIAELMTSNLRACSAGINPSNAFSTHTHFIFSLLQTALPMSMSKPCNWPDGDLLSNGGYEASMPKRSVSDDWAWAAPAMPANAAAMQKVSFRFMAGPVLGRDVAKLEYRRNVYDGL